MYQVIQFVVRRRLWVPDASWDTIMTTDLGDVNNFSFYITRDLVPSVWALSVLNLDF